MNDDMVIFSMGIIIGAALMFFACLLYLLYITKYTPKGKDEDLKVVPLEEDEEYSDWSGL